MQKINEKTRSKNFGMKSAFVVSLVLMASIGVAALLTSYGTVTGTVEVSQAVELSSSSSSQLLGMNCTEADTCTYTRQTDRTGGIYASPSFTATNYANRPVDVGFVVEITGIDTCTNSSCVQECIDYGINDMRVCTNGGTGSDVTLLDNCVGINMTNYTTLQVTPDTTNYIIVIDYDENACLGKYTIKTTVAPIDADL